jgi:hypothetical protein
MIPGILTPQVNWQSTAQMQMLKYPKGNQSTTQAGSTQRFGTIYPYRRYSSMNHTFLLDIAECARDQVLFWLGLERLVKP